MRKLLPHTALVILLNTVIFGQAPSLPAFDAASVKRSDPSPRNLSPNLCRGGPGTPDPGTLMCTNVALSYLVTLAYNLQFYELISPEWMIHGGKESGYDVAAKIPAGATKQQYRLMLQNLLAERFHLAVHRDPRNLPHYRLVSGKVVSRLKRSPEPPPAGPAFAMSIVNGHLHYEAHHRSLAQFADFLTTILSGPVTDDTGLAGDYEIALDFMPDDRWRGFAYLPRPSSAEAAEATPNLFVAVAEQLGLKLEATKGPLSVLVVDRADKIPVEN